MIAPVEKFPFLVKQSNPDVPYLYKQGIDNNYYHVCHVDKKKNRNYSKFKSQDDFFKYMIKNEEKGFFEIIPRGQENIKFYMDIDIKVSSIKTKNLDKAAEKIIADVKAQVISVFEEDFKVNVIPNIVVTSSHGPAKKSFHLVVDKYTFPSLEHVKMLYRKIVEPLDLNNQILDESVYKPNQNLRMVWNAKLEESNPRYKIPVDQIYSQINFENFQKFSVLSFDENTKHLTFEIPKKEHYSDITMTFANKNHNNKMLDFELSDEIKQMIEQFFESHNLQGVYQYDKIKDGFILFNRIQPALCPTCNRIHNSENAYMFVIKNKLRFNCRRNNDSLIVGRVTPSKEMIMFNSMDPYSHTDAYKKFFNGNQPSSFDLYEEASDYVFTSLARTLRYCEDQQMFIAKCKDHQVKFIDPVKLNRFSVNVKGYKNSITPAMFADKEPRWWITKTVVKPTIDYDNPNLSNDIINIFRGYGDYLTPEEEEKFDLENDEDMNQFFKLMKILFQTEENIEHMKNIISKSIQSDIPLQVLTLLYSEQGGLGKSLFFTFLKRFVWGRWNDEYDFRNNTTFFNSASELSSSFQDGILEDGNTKIIIDEFNSVKENGKSDEIAFSILKSFLTSDQIRTQVKCKQSIKSVNRHTWVGSTNNIRAIKNMSDTSISRRVWVVQCNDNYGQKIMSFDEHNKCFSPMKQLVVDPAFGRKLFTYFARREIPDGFDESNYPMDDFQKKVRSFSTPVFVSFVKDMIDDEIDLEGSDYHKKNGFLFITADSLKDEFHRYVNRNFNNFNCGVDYITREIAKMPFVEKLSGSKRIRFGSLLKTSYKIDIESAKAVLFE